MQVSDWVDIISTLAVVAVALWYTIETRKLRAESERQTQLLREQQRLEVAPFIAASIRLLSEEEFKATLQADKLLTEQDKERLLVRAKDVHGRVLCVLNNPTDELARNVKAYYYSHAHASFLPLARGQEWMEKGASAKILVGAEHITADQLRTRLKTAFGEALSLQLDVCIATDAQPFICVVFQDILGRSYIFRRSYSIRDERAVAGISKFSIVP